METDIIQVQVIETFASQFLIPLLMASIPGVLIGIALYFGLQRSRKKEAMSIEKLKKEIEIRGELVKKSTEQIETLEKRIWESYRKFCFADMAGDFSRFNGSDIIETQLGIISNYFEPHSSKFTHEFSEQLFHLSTVVTSLITEKFENRENLERDDSELLDSIFYVRELCQKIKNKIMEYL